MDTEVDQKPSRSNTPKSLYTIQITCYVLKKSVHADFVSHLSQQIKTRHQPFYLGGRRLNAIKEEEEKEYRRP